MSLTVFSLRQFQSEQAAWAARNFDVSDPVDPLLGLVEEVGELSHATLKARQGIRGTAEEHRAAARDAVGDIAVYLADFCTRSGFDLEEVIAETWDAVKARDWKKDNIFGGAKG